MTVTCDRFMREFIAFARSGECPVLDIRATYGVATAAALESGATVIASEVDERHLTPLNENAHSKITIHQTRIPRILLCFIGGKGSTGW